MEGSVQLTSLETQLKAVFPLVTYVDETVGGIMMLLCYSYLPWHLWVARQK